METSDTASSTPATFVTAFPKGVPLNPELVSLMDAKREKREAITFDEVNRDRVNLILFR